MITGARLPMEAFAQRLRDYMTANGITGISVGTNLDPNYATDFAKKWPAIWIAGQRLLPRDNGQGLAELARQNCNVQMLVVPVVQRLPPTTGSDPAEERLDALGTIVTQALFGWTPPGARLPLSFSSIVDGPAFETTCSLNIILATQTAYSGVNS